MINNMFITKLELNNQEIEQKETEFQDFVSDIEKADSVFRELKVFFDSLSLDESIKKYGITYWRWYVWLTWDRLNSLSKEDLIKVFANQVPAALALDFDVSKILIRYFIANTLFEGGTDSLYVKLKNAFQQSQAIVGVWKGKDVRVVELVKEIKLVSERNDSLEQAEFESKVNQIMFPNDPLIDEYVLVDFDEAVQRLIDLTVFFDQVDEGSIELVVNNFLNSLKFPDASLAEKESLSNNQNLEESGEIKEWAKEQEGKPELVETKIIKISTPQEIKLQIEKEFKKDREGNFEDIDAVMRKLEEFVEKYNDPKIADLLYFDEEENRFKWKV